MVSRGRRGPGVVPAVHENATVVQEGRYGPRRTPRCFRLGIRGDLRCWGCISPSRIRGPRHTLGIVAVVNGNIISNYDLDQHVALFAVTSGNPVSQETLPEIRLQVLTSLEDQVIRAARGGKALVITVTNAEVDKGVQNVAGRQTILALSK